MDIEGSFQQMVDLSWNVRVQFGVEQSHHEFHLELLAQLASLLFVGQRPHLIDLVIGVLPLLGPIVQIALSLNNFEQLKILLFSVHGHEIGVLHQREQVLSSVFLSYI